MHPRRVGAFLRRCSHSLPMRVFASPHRGQRSEYVLPKYGIRLFRANSGYFRNHRYSACYLQIFSTIRAKEELKETQQEIKDGFESRLQYLENQMEQLSNKQSRADGIEEAKEQIDKAIDLALPKDVLERVNLDIAKKGTKLYEWLWSIIDEVKTNGQILDDYAKALKKCRKRVLYINGREATEIEVIELANEIRPIKLMILGAIKK